MEYDFSGWATRNDVRCSDGRTIRKNAFIDDDGKTVPLVWNHRHEDPFNVLGHALLENRDEGVYVYCTFNETESGKQAKDLVTHGDITALSIYANKLKQESGNVMHGAIREVSLVHAGANPRAFIDSVIAHSEDTEEEVVIYTGETFMLNSEENASISHAAKEEAEPKPETEIKEEKKMATENKEKTIKEVFDELTDEQKKVVYAMIGIAVEEAKKESKEEMGHNVFDNDEREGMDVLSHSDMEAIFADAKRNGSLRESVLAHTDDYGIEDISYLFPDDKSIGNAPDFIKRPDDWVAKFMNSVHHTPFSRVKSIHANITAEEARAKGYTKGNRKIDEVITLLRRNTSPTTIYKKQKLDRDDIVDIKDFDIVAWLKAEMRGMLDEEIARAALVGDQRSSASDDKIDESHIRPIWTDDPLYTIQHTVSVSGGDTDDQKARKFIRECIRARKDYRGSGNPTMYTTEDVLTRCLLIEDLNGHVIYDTIEKLTTALRVKEIVTTPVMENLSRTVDGNLVNLLAIIVNPIDYNIGADKGGEVNMFDDFDIDYNQQKYLMEARCSGALIKPYSAIVIEGSF